MHPDTTDKIFNVLLLGLGEELNEAQNNAVKKTGKYLPFESFKLQL
jgi:hypothetical protein